MTEQSSPSGILPQIKHIVVLMMENRSLDNLLGFLYADQNNQPAYNIPDTGGIPTYNGLLANTYYNQLSATSPRVYASQGADSTVTPTPDPGEAFDQMTQQIFGNSTTADMSGFLLNYASIDSNNPDQIMQSYSPSQVPVISQIAKNFALSDAWYASCPCQTWPNRGFVHTGSSDGHINNDHYELYDIETVFNVLHDQSVSWGVYNDTILPSLVHIMFPKLWLHPTHFHGMDKFYQACQAPADADDKDKLKKYTFLEPNFLDPDESYHPPHNIDPAEKFLAEVYQAIQQCPYRDEVLFVITFDEHGGTYDHVAPPNGAAPPYPGAVSRHENFHFDRYGVRIPTIVVSSYVQPQTVFRAAGSTPYDHTSILATIRDWAGLQKTFAKKLPSPRIAAAPNLDSVLGSKAVNPWPSVSIPTAAEAQAVTPDTALDPLQQSVLIGSLSVKAGGYIGKENVLNWLERLRTVDDARQFITEQLT